MRQIIRLHRSELPSVSSAIQIDSISFRDFRIDLITVHRSQKQGRRTLVRCSLRRCTNFENHNFPDKTLRWTDTKSQSTTQIKIATGFQIGNYHVQRNVAIGFCEGLQNAAEIRIAETRYETDSVPNTRERRNTQEQQVQTYINGDLAHLQSPERSSSYGDNTSQKKTSSSPRR